MKANDTVKEKAMIKLKEVKSKFKDSMVNTNTESKESINSDNLFQSIGKIGEAEGVGEFKFQRFFGGIFKKHTVEEIEQSLIVGTKKTTPEINEVILEYPQPWLFFRLVSASIVLFYAFFFAYRYFDNTKLVPGLIFSGSFAVPISTLFLFFELNIRKNVPLWQVIRLVFFGGILSMVFTLILFQNTESLSNAFGASSAGLIEEPA